MWLVYIKHSNHNERCCCCCFHKMAAWGYAADSVQHLLRFTVSPHEVICILIIALYLSRSEKDLIY